MNSNLSNLIKNLNNTDYIFVLEEIGKSDRPINRYKVMKNLDESTYIYDIIDEFCPSEYTTGSYLFDLDSINENNQDVNFKHKLIQNLNRIYHLKWRLHDKEDKLNINKSIKFKKTEDAKSCYIYHGKQNLVCITFGFDEPIRNEAIIHIWNNGNEVDLKDDKLLIKSSKNDGKLSFYTRKHNPKHRWYLDVVLNEKTKEQENNSKIKEYWEYVKYINSNISQTKIPDEILYKIINDSDCMKIIRNKEYWEYRLNFRGFLLYLYGESLLKRSRFKSKSEIGKVICNNLVLEIAPFLKYWDHLDEAGFNVIRILKDIGSEFMNQLDIYTKDHNYLLRQVSERYFTEVEFFLNFVFNNPFYLHDWINNKKLGVEKFREKKQKLFEYRIFMLQLLDEWTTDHHEYIKSNYRYCHEEYQRLYNSRH